MLYNVLNTKPYIELNLRTYKELEATSTPLYANSSINCITNVITNSLKNILESTSLSSNSTIISNPVIYKRVSLSINSVLLVSAKATLIKRNSSLISSSCNMNISTTIRDYCASDIIVTSELNVDNFLKITANSELSAKLTLKRYCNAVSYTNSNIITDNFINILICKSSIQSSNLLLVNVLIVKNDSVLIDDYCNIDNKELIKKYSSTSIIDTSTVSAKITFILYCNSNMQINSNINSNTNILKLCVFGLLIGSSINVVIGCKIFDNSHIQSNLIMDSEPTVKKFTDSKIDNVSYTDFSFIVNLIQRIFTNNIVMILSYDNNITFKTVHNKNVECIDRFYTNTNLNTNYNENIKCVDKFYVNANFSKEVM